jgi:uncharacterized membrane protein YbhN (UPF0104 family)
VPGFRRATLTFLRVAGTAGVAAYVLTRVSPSDLVATMRRVHPGILGAAVLLYLLGQGLSAVRWFLLGRAVGLYRPFGDYARFYAIGMFFNLFGPSTLGGDAVRVMYLGRGQRRLLAAGSVLFDRMSGLAMLVALAAVTQAVYHPRLPRALATSVTTVGLLLFVGWVAAPWLIRVLPREQRLRRWVEKELAPFWRDGSLLAWTAALSVVFHLSQVAVQYLLGRSIGAALPFWYCLVFHPLVVLATALPVSLGGFGVREGGYVLLLGRIGIAPSEAVVLSLMWFGVTAVAGLLGGLVFVTNPRPAAAPPM